MRAQPQWRVRLVVQPHQSQDSKRHQKMRTFFGLLFR